MCLSVHVCICIWVCVRARSRVGLCVHLYIDVCVCLYACMLASNCCIVCIWQTSPLSSVRPRMQSSPYSADSHFLRWLTAVHVNNNICSTFIYLPNNILYCTLTEDGYANFIFIFKFLKSTVERMNERILQLLSPPRKLKGNARGCVFWRSMVINTLGVICLLRMWAFISLLVK